MKFYGRGKFRDGEVTAKSVGVTFRDSPEFRERGEGQPLERGGYRRKSQHTIPGGGRSPAGARRFFLGNVDAGFPTTQWFLDQIVLN